MPTIATINSNNKECLPKGFAEKGKSVVSIDCQLKEKP